MSLHTAEELFLHESVLSAHPIAGYFKFCLYQFYLKSLNDVGFNASFFLSFFLFFFLFS